MLSERFDSKYRILQNLLSKKGIAEPAGLKDFYKKYLLKVDFPMLVGVDSAYQRGKRIIEEVSGAKLYGKIDREIFAVRYNWYGEEHLTVYLPGIDFVRDYAEVLQSQLEIKEGLAMKISKSLAHDEYYLARRGNIYTDPVVFSSNIIRVFNPEIGTEIFDELNKKYVKVFGYNGRRYVNFDIEMPAVFKKNRALFIYEPDSKLDKSNC